MYVGVNHQFKGYMKIGDWERRVKWLRTIQLTDGHTYYVALGLESRYPFMHIFSRFLFKPYFQFEIEMNGG